MNRSLWQRFGPRQAVLGKNTCDQERPKIEVGEVLQISEIADETFTPLLA